MYAHADVTRENERRSAANRVAPRQGLADSVPSYAGERPLAVAQRRQQEIANDGPRVRQLKAYRRMVNDRYAAPSGEPVQRVQRDARVTWATTHLVQVQGPEDQESLFGADWRTGELPPELGQLSHGQVITVDDEAVFMSRRGANQENRLRRAKDEDDDELRHRWLRVESVQVDGESKKVPAGTYVRAETIALDEVEKPPRRAIGIAQPGPDEGQRVTEDLERFNLAWKQAEKKRRRSVGQVVMDFHGKETDDGDEITSGWNWDQFDEGLNVSEDMSDPEERVPFNPRQQVLRAEYTDGPEQEPIAYMILETVDGEEPPYMYIRWLVGHPERRGGGSVLLNEAKARFDAQNKLKLLKVDSALSAVEWYIAGGFRKEDPRRNPVKKGEGYADTRLVYP